MNRQRRNQWPAELGPNTPTERARTVARGYRTLSAKWAPIFESCTNADRPRLAREFAAELAALDAMSDRFGETCWLIGQEDLTSPGDTLTREDVAARAGVSPEAVTMWASRGIRRGGRTLHLIPHRGRYDPDAVDRFLRSRDQPAEHPRRAQPEGAS